MDRNHTRHVMAALEGRQIMLPAHVDAGLRDSWMRSAAKHGLEPDRIAEPEVLTQSELSERRAPLEELSALSSPEIDRLFRRLLDHAQVVMMTDADGVVVVYRIRAEELDHCSRLRVVPGSIWTEESQGTCGVALCLKEQRPVSVVMGEHFATKLSALTCTVAPIFGAGGRLAATLNVSALRGSDHAFQSVVRQMVAGSARRIENVFFDRRHANDLILRLSRHDDFCDAAAEARVALDGAGRVIDATPMAQKLLADPDARETATQLIGQKFGALAGVSDVERLLRDAGASIEAPRGRVHMRVTGPSRRIAGSSVSLAMSGRRTRMRLDAVDELPHRQPGQAPMTLHDIVGDDDAMMERIRVAQRVHARGLPLLLQGESGTGKTQLARLLHEAGPQRNGFVAVNCAAIPRELIESELFGYRPGAFTGAARQGSPGRLVSANGGSLFLDEIGDMPLALQARLLQVLSEGEFVPVGATEPVRVRFALFSASLHDLPTLVREGRFREDLYYRLGGATVTLPPLRARSDRLRLIEAAFRRAAIESGFDDCTLTAGARGVLMEHAWPGNIRELQHVARFAMAVSDSSLVGIHCLPAPLNDGVGLAVQRARMPGRDSDPDVVADALARHDWNVSAAAIHLGISRATLHRRIVEFKLRRPDRRPN